MTRSILLLALLTATPPLLSARESAVFDSAGKLTSLIHQGEEVAIHAGWWAHYAGQSETTLQLHDQSAPVTRPDPLGFTWQGSREFANGQSLAFDIAWEPGAEATRFETTIKAPRQRFGPEPESVDFVVDLPRERFVGGQLVSAGILLSATKPADPVFYQTETDRLEFTDARGNWTFVLKLDSTAKISVEDFWTVGGWQRDERSYRIRVEGHPGRGEAEQAVKLGGSLQLRGTPQPAPVTLSIDPSSARYPFQGFGGNFCWGWQDGTEITDFMIETLDLAWSRHEMKLLQWDHERDKPGEELRSDFARIQRIAEAGVPWIISIWHAPERFFEHPNAEPPSTFGRHLAPERWPEFLELIGSYLDYLRKNYGVEPDLLSFNEPDLGVYVGATPQRHRDAILHLGRYLESHGFKTKLLLGDTANPRGTHQYLLPTGRDSEAMRYVGALSFHSWFGASPEEYRRWAEIARWLDKPLLIGEAGFDPGSYRNRDYDSYDNGLDETLETMRALVFAEPQASLFWQFTDDYALARRGPDGSAEPTGRYWLMKHFTNLTPSASTVVASTSDQPDVWVAAFVNEATTVLHILNLGAEREAAFQGLPGGDWERITTQDGDGFVTGPPVSVDATGKTSLTLPARSLTTLKRS